MSFNLQSSHLINLLHGSTGLLERWDILGGRSSWGLLGGSVNGQTEGDHSVDSGSKVLWGGEGESRGQERGLEEEVGEVSDSLVSLVLGNSFLELLDDWVGGVELHGLLRGHV